MSDIETPSQAIIRAANTPEIVVDGKGRSLSVLRVEGSALSRFLRACGSAGSAEVWLTLTLARAAVRSIDGTPMLFPDTMPKIDAMWDIVDADACNAVMEHFNTQAEVDARDETKNS